MARARRNRGPKRADSACAQGAGTAAPTPRSARSVRAGRCRRQGGGPGGGRSAQSVPEHRGEACQIRGGPDAETQIMGPGAGPGALPRPAASRAANARRGAARRPSESEPRRAGLPVGPSYRWAARISDDTESHAVFQQGPGQRNGESGPISIC